MIASAKAGDTISYTDLVAKIAAIPFEPHDVRLDRLLEAVARDEENAGRGLLTVVVVHKHGDKMPGPGFFDLATQLGRDTKDRVVCWVREVERIYDQWK